MATIPRKKLFTGPYAQQNASLYGEITTLCAVARLKQTELAEKLGISAPTLSERKCDPDQFRLGDLRRLAELCKTYGVPFSNLF